MDINNGDLWWFMDSINNGDLLGIILYIPLGNNDLWTGESAFSETVDHQNQFYHVFLFAMASIAKDS